MKHPIIEAPGPVKLSDYDPDDTNGLTKEEAAQRLPELLQRLEALQGWLYGAQQQGVLVILQGMDTSGKDGAVKKVFSGFNPSGCHVWSFKVPTEEERRHDFLWRIHQRTPERGMIAIFNRSHYEDVLVARVHHLVPKEVWEQRYQQINNFERMLAENQTLIFKFFLHISRQEQEQRLLAREADPEAAWKLSVSDWQERASWSAYREVYEEALARCSTAWAPWHIVPGNKKWYRNYLIARTLLEQLEPYERGWKAALKEESERKRAELEAYHAQQQQSQNQEAPAGDHKPKPSKAQSPAGNKK